MGKPCSPWSPLSCARSLDSQVRGHTVCAAQYQPALETTLYRALYYISLKSTTLHHMNFTPLEWKNYHIFPVFLWVSPWGTGFFNYSWLSICVVTGSKHHVLVAILAKTNLLVFGLDCHLFAPLASSLDSQSSSSLWKCLSWQDLSLLPFPKPPPIHPPTLPQIRWAVCLPCPEAVPREIAAKCQKLQHSTPTKGRPPGC